MSGLDLGGRAILDGGYLLEAVGLGGEDRFGVNGFGGADDGLEADGFSDADNGLEAVDGFGGTDDGLKVGEGFSGADDGFEAVGFSGADDGQEEFALHMPFARSAQWRSKVSANWTPLNQIQLGPWALMTA
ncbi:hypothetical protein BDK51DRAFT_40002 [Blyttiomyces helicus]|uniref:Uncharacterized protein n=1 Tax=Blyttiomyces helicus TaxID=388810 RepID=A0A4P9VXM7_9FUNG|nr:hypothetical protein BDK51DRAFT_40002 [Blyttiomyces helicus]|eukprot:RKO84501.1 hypothetical protein BDK51DRAFT_40002 [Blyttiomyces helicus]